MSTSLPDFMYVLKREVNPYFGADFHDSSETLTKYHQTHEQDTHKKIKIECSVNIPKQTQKIINNFRITTTYYQKSTSKTPPISLFWDHLKPSQKIDKHQTHKPDPEKALPPHTKTSSITSFQSTLNIKLIDIKNFLTFNTHWHTYFEQIDCPPD